jgi:hypothetical protein
MVWFWDIFWTLYGWREVPFARSISSSFRRVESEGESNCICVMEKE